MRCGFRQFCSLKQTVSDLWSLFPPHQDGKCYNQNQVTRDQCMKEQLLHAVMHNICVLEMIHLVCVIYMEMCWRSIAENNLLYSYSPNRADL